MSPGDARQLLLDAAVDHVTAHGIGDLTLRGLANELGTSHRMLIHHFGSKQGLWVAIVGEVERRQRELFTRPSVDPPGSVEAALRAWWTHISDPSLWPSERLFFEVYSRALRQPDASGDLLDDAVEPWTTPAAAQAEALGVSPQDSVAFARLGVAVTRGLLLDLLATGDREGVDRAMELWISLAAHTVED